MLLQGKIYVLREGQIAGGELLTADVHADIASLEYKIVDKASGTCSCVSLSAN